MRRSAVLPWLIFLPGWLMFSAGFVLFGFTIVAYIFGREGNGYHLAGFALVLALWIPFSVAAVGAMRRES